MFGAISERTIFALLFDLSISFMIVPLSVTSPIKVSTPLIGLIYRISTPITIPSGYVRSYATCSHPPGLAPKSITVFPGLKILNLLSI